MFKKLFGFGKSKDSNTPAPPSRDPDPSFGSPCVSQGASLLLSGDFDNLTEQYQKSKSWEKSLLVANLAFEDQYTAKILEWVSAQTDSYISHLFRGANCVHLAWESRTAKWAEEVTEEQWEGFLNYLYKAEKHFQTSLELNPYEAETHARTIPMYMGLSDREAVLNHFQNAIQLDSNHFYAHSATLNALKDKWLGSKQEMYEFVDQIITTNPNPFFKTLMLECFIEDALGYLREENGREKLDNFLKNEDFKADFFKLYNEFSPTQEPKEIIYPIQNKFCFLLYLMKEKALAKKEFEKFKGHMSATPWNYLRGIKTNKDLQNLFS